MGQKKAKIIITVLAVLLGISLVALGATVMYARSLKAQSATVTVPDNSITASTLSAVTVDTGITDGRHIRMNGCARNSASSAPISIKTQDAANLVSANDDATLLPMSSVGTKKVELTLNNKQASDNEPFSVSNMLPGDSKENYFNVNVSHSKTVTVHFRADVRDGYEKLAEVLKVKVVMGDGKLVYDGLMRDLDDIKYKLTGSGEDVLSYDITAYLETSVGNDYQRKELVADFVWWVNDKEAENLSGGRGYSKWWYKWKEELAGKTEGQQTGTAATTTEVPDTGDTFPLALLAALLIISGGGLIFLLLHRRRKEDEKNG